MKKRYCKNCKWHQPFGWWHPECWRFAAYYGREIKGHIYQEYVGKLEKDIKLNENNTCFHYKPKWYKWWLK